MRGKVFCADKVVTTRYNPKTAIGFGRISQRLRAGAHWTLPRRTLWFVERKEQCANAEEFAKGVPNAIAVFGYNNLSTFP
jgi:hypothetical protein